MEDGKVLRKRKIQEQPFDAAAVDRAFAKLGEELEQREASRRSSAQAARNRMIERQSQHEHNERPSGTSKIPLWSN